MVFNKTETVITGSQYCAVGKPRNDPCLVSEAAVFGVVGPKASLGSKLHKSASVGTYPKVIL